MVKARFGPVRRFLLALLSALVLLGASVLAPPTAYAEACGMFASSLQAAWGTAGWAGTQPRTFEGSKVRLLDRGGYAPCSESSTTTISTWASIYGTGGYAQAGTFYINAFSGCVHRWAEQAWAGTYQDYFIEGCSLPGETHDYWNQSVYTNDRHMRSNIDLTVIHESTWNQFGQWGGTWQVAFSSEAKNYTSHIPGSSIAPQDFGTLEVQDRVNDQWYGTCNNAFMGWVNDNPTRWGLDAPACNHTRSWQK